MLTGQFYVATVTSSDPANFPVNLDLVVASSSDPSVTVAKQPDNTFIVTAVSVGSANVTYSAPGFDPAVESVAVTARPKLVATDGPIQG